MSKTSTSTVRALPLDDWFALDMEAGARLADRLGEHQVKAPPYMPIADNILVLRLPAPAKETKTRGGLFIPDSAQEEPEPLSEGIIIEAGLQARDVLRDHGILIGDHVQIGRFAGYEKEFQKDEAGAGKRILQMKERDILGSFDLYPRLYGKQPSMRIVLDTETNEHRIVPVGSEQ